MEGVICWDCEANSIDEEFGSHVEEDEEEVQSSKSENDIHLLDACLLLKLIEVLVLAQLEFC
jgi:hypothetical protein